MNGTEAEQVAEAYRPSAAGSFFLNWLQDPLSVGAVAPSGRFLARLMTAGLGPEARVVELGAGTGTLTQAILDRGVAPENLCVVEQNPHFAALLERRFPRCEVVVGDAVDLGEHLRCAGTFDVVVSGLPLLLFSRAQKRRLLEAAFSVLSPAGCFHQFTYGGRCSVRRGLLEELGLRTSLIGVSPLNLPPAFVYRIERGGADPMERESVYGTERGEADHATERGEAVERNDA